MGVNTVAEAFSELGIALVVIIIRLISRISLLGIRKLQLDDCLMALAGVSIFSTCNVGLSIDQNCISVCTRQRLLPPTMWLSMTDLRTA